MKEKLDYSDSRGYSESRREFIKGLLASAVGLIDPAKIDLAEKSLNLYGKLGNLSTEVDQEPQTSPFLPNLIIQKTIDRVEKASIPTRGGAARIELPPLLPNFEETREMALGFDHATCMLKENAKPLTLKQLNHLAQNVVPKILAEIGVEAINITPITIKIVDTRNRGDRYYAVSATTDYRTNTITINSRLVDHRVEWFGFLSLLGTIIHEIIHCYQGYLSDVVNEQNNLIERTAQIVMLEVLAAMALNSDQLALTSLCYELRQMFMDIAELQSKYEKREDEFSALQKETNHFGAVDQLIARELKRIKGGKYEKLHLVNYSAEPIEMTYNYYKYNKPIMQLALKQTARLRSNWYEWREDARGVGLSNLCLFLDNFNAIINFVPKIKNLDQT